MGIIGKILLAVFIIIAILLILLVLIQNEEGDGLGGIFAGGSASAFGSRSGNILTKTTSILGALFLILSLGMAMLNRDTDISGVEAAGLEQLGEQEGDWFWESETNLDTTPQSDWFWDPNAAETEEAPIPIPETGDTAIQE